GAILYEILTGSPPFAGPDTTAVLRRVVHEPPEPPRIVVPEAPKPLEAVCLKALAKSPADRYGAVKDLTDEGQHWMADEPVSAYREPLTVRLGRWGRRHRTGVAVAAALLVVGVAGLAINNVLVSRQRARAEENRAKAEANFDLARTAVDDMYTQVAEKWLAQESRMEPVQREFLIKALKFYEQFAQPAGSSAEVRLEAGKGARRGGAVPTRPGGNAGAERRLPNANRRP